MEVECWDGVFRLFSPGGLPTCPWPWDVSQRAPSITHSDEHTEVEMAWPLRRLLSLRTGGCHPHHPLPCDVFVRVHLQGSKPQIPNLLESPHRVCVRWCQNTSSAGCATPTTQIENAQAQKGHALDSSKSIHPGHAWA